MDWLKPYSIPAQAASTLPSEAVWLALAFSRQDPTAAFQWLEMAARHTTAKNQPVLEAEFVFQGWMLGHLYQTSKERPVLLKKSAPLYDTIVTHLRSVLATHDRRGDGLLALPIEDTFVEMPLLNTLFASSCEALIKLGGLLRKDVSELMEWHDLCIWSMNEKLWDEAKGCYQSFDVKSQSRLADLSINRFLPMMGGIPTQEQAEMMLETLLQQPFPEADVAAHWLLYKGLRHYDMDETALSLKAASMEHPLTVDSTEKAAICLEWKSR